MQKSNITKNIAKKDKAKESIHRSLTNYIEQLKIHFSISDNDINAIIKNILKARQGESAFKNWFKNLTNR